MSDAKRLLSGLAVAVFLVAAIEIQPQARSVGSDEEIANGLDPVTTGQAIGNYPGGTLLAGEHFPAFMETFASATDEEIANGLDPITTGQAIGNYSGGTLLAGEHLPYEAPGHLPAQYANQAREIEPMPVVYQ